MKQIFVSKASPMPGKKVDGVEIHIKESLIESKIPVQELYKNEAKYIIDTLKENLPQGTMHQLLILMLQNHENLLVHNSKR